MSTSTKLASLADIQNIKYLLDNSPKIKIRESKYELVVFIKKKRLTDTEVEKQEELKRKISNYYQE